MKVPVYRLKLVKDRLLELSEKVLSQPYAAARFVERWISTCDREHLVSVFLDAECRIIGAQIIAVGSLGGVHTTGREVFKAAILANAHGLVLGHNHPNGSLEPSKEDIRMTRRLSFLGKLLGIRLHDHVVVSRSGFRSMREMGLVPSATGNGESEAA